MSNQTYWLPQQQPQPSSHSNPASVGSRPIPSPASVGGPVTPALTPKPHGAPGSVSAPRTPGSMLSPMNNGQPPTPSGGDPGGLLDPKTPKSVGGPPTPYSPFSNSKSAPEVTSRAAVKMEMKAEPSLSQQTVNPYSEQQNSSLRPTTGPSSHQVLPLTFLCLIFVQKLLICLEDKLIAH